MRSLHAKFLVVGASAFALVSGCDGNDAKASAPGGDGPEA
jgi:hypothetical protein